MQDNKVKIWIGIGAFVFGGTTSVNAATPFSASGTVPLITERLGASPLPAVSPTMTAIQVAQGGEGGEGGERGAVSGLSPLTATASRLLMMQGHLRAGADLLATRDRKGAALHFAHPQAELYQEVTKFLLALGISPFDKSLQRVVDLTTGGADPKEVRAALNKANAEVDAALKKTIIKLSPAEIARAVIAVLTAAANEYAASIKDGQFVNIEEYQDARGFIIVARKFLADAKALQEKDTRTHQSIRSHVDELASALDTPVPPSKPVLTTESMYGTVSRAELAASSIIKSGNSAEGGEGRERRR